MKNLLFAILILALVGCTSTSSKRETFDLIDAEMKKATEAKEQAGVPSAVSAALLPPLKAELPQAREPLEERFTLALNNVPANQFFNALATGTRYNMLVHPEVGGTISANLKEVTLFEALDAIRELYGYDYKVEGTRIYIKPLTMQTRVFQVNYLTGNRQGTSDIRVTSGSVSDSSSAGGAPAGGTAQGAVTSPGVTSHSLNSSKINTTSSSDFWKELKASLEAIVSAGKDGRSVVISPQSGVVVIRAMPDELRNVEAYLNATQLSVERQVILEAKILEVRLNDSFQSGINWASFASLRGNTTNRASAGLVTPGTELTPLQAFDGLPNPLASAGNTAISATPGATLGAAASAAASLFGLAFQTSNFAALISFLETQGNVHVLSSPRIATLNNQKAVLKVGTDEFFVTNVSSTTTTGTSTTTTPTVTLQPFFSGVALDVTPQIDAGGNIILHIHPSVSNVTTVAKTIDLGSGGSLNLPLASSAVSETDSVVRGQNGHIIAIGGLMRQSTVSDKAQVPGAGDFPGLGALFRNNSQVTSKSELVILLRPTVIQGNSSWTQDMLDAQRRIKNLEPRIVPE